MEHDYIVTIENKQNQIGNKQNQIENKQNQMEDETKEFASCIVGELIAERKRQGVTQQQIADKTGIKAPNVTRVESCKYTPTLNILMRYAKALGKEIRFELVDAENEE